MVDQAKEKEFLVPEGADQEKIAMGVIPTFGFGVYVYQNPPDVEVSRVEITDFTYTFDDDNRYVQLSAKNLGDGISYCKSYLEIVGFNNGFNERLPLKQFNVFPGQSRDFNLQLPGNLEPGSYSVMAVIDFGSDEELQAAEIEITVN